MEECQIFESNGKQVAAFRKAAEARASGGNVSRVCAAAEQNGHVVGRVALVVSLVGVKEQERRIRTAYTAVQCTMRQAFGTLEGGVQEQSRSQAKRAAMLALKTSAGAVALGLMFALSTSSSVARPLRLVVSVLERAAERDSAQHLNVASRDEVGHMARALNKTLEKIHRGGHQKRRRACCTRERGSRCQFGPDVKWRAAGIRQGPRRGCRG